MFPQFGASSETLSKASTIMFRLGTDAHLYDDPEDVNIAPLLDSKFDSEKCEALKRLLALIAQGFDVSNFFPQVVKNVASQSLEVKKLVYLYLLHYAEKRPNEALLSINSFQKDLGDTNPLVRAWALRTMAGIRLLVIAPLVLVAVGKCARDPSVYVRKCAANALPKLHDLHLEEHSSTIEEIVGILLCDHSPGVVGAAAAAFASVCPSNYALIGRNYRKLCEVLPDVEEWGQIVLIGLLLRYAIARHGLVKESVMSSLHGKESSQFEKDRLDVGFSLEKESSNVTWKYDHELANMVSRCYIEGPDEYLSRTNYANKASSEFNGAQFTSGKSNDDVKVLLRCTLPLLWSNNSAVVLAAAGVQWIMAPCEDVRRIVQPLLFLLRSSNSSRYVVLCNIQVFAKPMPLVFSPHFEDFFVLSSDSYQIKALKLEILCSIATESTISSIFKEFQDYIRDPDRRFAADTVATIGLCAQRLPKMANTCLEGLFAVTRKDFFTSDFGFIDGEADVLVQAITSIKTIIKQDPSSHEKVVIQLVRSLDSVKVPAARAIIIWMVGEYSNLGEIIPRMLTTVLKYLASRFSSEALETKLQILNTILKVLSSTKEEDLCTFKKVGYVLELAEFDLKYDVRDRVRLIKKLLSSKLESQEIQNDMNCSHQKEDLTHVLADCMFRGKTKHLPSEPINYQIYLPGSLSQIVLHAAPGYESLPKPGNVLHDEHSLLSSTNRETDVLGEGTDGSGTISGSSDGETVSDYSAGDSITDSGDDRGSDDIDSATESGNDDPLIQVSDTGDAHLNENGVPQSASTDLEELMSKRSLESWLDEQSDLSNPSTSEQRQVSRSSARISLRDIRSQVKPKSYVLLDPANGNGLKVSYSFSSEISSISPLLMCVEVSFENCSTESISEVTLVDEESNKPSDSVESSPTSNNDAPTFVPMEEITSLEPGRTTKRILHVHFHHHLLPLKLVLYCNGKKLPVKLRPDIGYFVKPLPMNIETFTDKESHLPGMFEYKRRGTSCTFSDHIEELNKDKVDMLMRDKFLLVCESLAGKMLSNANLFLVSVDMPIAANFDDASGLCLRFSSEILSNSKPCLITITAEGKCTEPLNLCIKVNCEETVFGLNLLNRIVNFLS